MVGSGGWAVRASLAAVLAGLGLLAAGCRSSPESAAPGTTTTSTTLAGRTPTPPTATPAYATTVTSPGPINPAAIPLGDGYLSSTPKVGYVDSCQSFSTTGSGGGGSPGGAGSPGGPGGGPGGAGGARVDGPWINLTTKTWDSLTKVSVQGSVSWPAARYSVTVSGEKRIISTDDLPTRHTTGVFPIASSDPAYAYDHNPNRIVPMSITWSLPLNPVAVPTPSCTSGGPIGVLDDGVLLFNALDGEGRDAVAHELLDSCGEHPQMDDMLHHHDVPACLLDQATGRSTLVGYALDGYGIYVERDASGALLTNTDLDACHGRTSVVLWNGKEQSVYHYDATLEYPYTVGCFHGTPISTGPMG
jgi:YHYH protein